MSWLGDEWHKFAIGLLTLDHGWCRLVDWEEHWIKAKALFGRRKGDYDMIDPLKIIALIPKFEKIVQDAEATANSPETKQLLTDLKEALAQARIDFGAPPK